jgi:outer membrane protein OmpA-like peptidoglycan-associated protein
MGACVATMDRFSVREYRVETGLRWHWNPFQKPDAPELLASLQYGWHATTVAKRGSGALVGPPDVAYHYLTVGIGARIPFAHFIGISPRVHVHAPFTAGDLQSPSQYGGGSLWGVRAGGHLELTLWEGLTLYLGGFYERFGISIGAGATKVVTGGATDQYYGAIASIGYVDHRGALPDTDRDGTSDGSDRCPTEAGPRDNGGCPLADGDGDGTPDRDDRCPKVAGPKAFRGCPDKDGDGLTDAEDRCPDTAGSKELSGCLDADGDGLVDPEDDCPTAPGDKANRGCPTYRTVKVTGERIEISEKIFFAYDKTDILPKSFELLDDVVRALGDHPHIRVRIDGHTDASGSEARNQELSEGRARAVRDYLVGHGIAEDRLEAKGHGSQYPIDSNKTLSGRENNRRVEFVIVKEKKERE